MAVCEIAQREEMIKQYHGWRQLLVRAFWGTVHVTVRWFARWWKVRFDLGLLQVAYILSLIITLVVGAVAAVEKLRFAPPPAVAASPSVWAKSQMLISNWGPILGAGAVAIALWYKTRTGGFGKPHETERRKGVASLLEKLNRSGAVDHVKASEQFEARLIEICECVRRDLEEMFGLPEEDVEVVLLRWVRKGDGDAGHFVQLARDRSEMGGSFFSGGQTRAVLETFVYESIRIRRTIAFHDLKSRFFRRFFPDVNLAYRSVVAVPILKPHQSQPHALLTVKLKYPYLLWPKKDVVLERRLSLYVQLLNVFCPVEAR